MSNVNIDYEKINTLPEIDLFNNHGHFSSTGFKAIINGKLNELQSLEAAEHLSFCNACLLEYTELAEQNTVFEPQHSVKETVLEKIKKPKGHGIKIAFSKYATIAAAACIAIMMWNIATFASTTDKSFSAPNNNSGFLGNVQYVFENIGESGKYFNENLNSFFQTFAKPKENIEKQNIKDTASTSKPKEKKKFFNFGKTNNNNIIDKYANPELEELEQKLEERDKAEQDFLTARQKEESFNSSKNNTNDE